MPLTKIQSLGITDGTIVAGDIASGAITAAKLASGVGGKVLQVSSVVSTTTTQTLSTETYTDLTSLSLSITPSSASNKILLMANINCGLNNDEGFGIKFFRDATNIYTTTQIYAIYIYAASGSPEKIDTSPFVHLDSPSTTSSITYKIQGSAYGAGRTVIFNNGMPSIFYAMEIAV